MNKDEIKNNAPDGATHYKIFDFGYNIVEYYKPHDSEFWDLYWDVAMQWWGSCQKIATIDGIVKID